MVFKLSIFGQFYFRKGDKFAGHLSSISVNSKQFQLSELLNIQIVGCFTSGFTLEKFQKRRLHTADLKGVTNNDFRFN